MYFVMDCFDALAALSLRAEHRKAHLAYLEGVAGRILSAGPRLDESGTPCGSVLIIDFKDEKEALAFARGDPYARAGVFREVRIHRYRQIFPSRRDGV